MAAAVPALGPGEGEGLLVNSTVGVGFSKLSDGLGVDAGSG